MKQILVIDDERPIRNTLKEILEYEKFKVDEAEDGQAGLEKIKAGKAKLQINYNIDRSNLVPSNPIDVNFEKLHVSAPSNKYNTTKSTTVTPIGEGSPTTKKSTFLYAKVKASQDKYTVTGNAAIATPVQLYVYCQGLGTCSNYGKRTSLSGNAWWLATKNRRANSFTTIALKTQAITTGKGNIKFNHNSIKIPVDGTGVSDDTATVNATDSTLTSQCPALPYNADAALNGVSDWVTTNVPLYNIRCIAGSNWSGVGNESRVVGGGAGAGASSVKSNKRMSW